MTIGSVIIRVGSRRTSRIVVSVDLFMVVIAAYNIRRIYSMVMCKLLRNYLNATEAADKTCYQYP